MVSIKKLIEKLSQAYISPFIKDDELEDELVAILGEDIIWTPTEWMED